MFYRWRVGKIPDGNTPLVGQSVAVRRISDGGTITTLTTDANGFITLQADGHYEPFYLHLADVPGGDKYWRSDESHTVGVLNPKELPAALRALGDGVIRGKGSELAVALTGGGPSFTVSDGAANVAGHPFVVYSASTAFTNTRPVSGTRVDRVIIRLYPEGSATTPGKADLALLQGTIDAGTPALTQTSTVHEVGLYTIMVPVAGAVTLTDERVFSNELTPVTAITRSDAVTTTNASGEILTALNASLVLPRTSDYLVTAEVSAIHDNGVGWVPQGTFGSLGSGTSPNFNTPEQPFVDSSDNVYVADYWNARLVKLNSSGAYVSSITGFTGIVGVCVDASNAIYITGRTGVGTSYVQKRTSAFAIVWTNVSNHGGTHLATDGSFVYCTNVTLSGVVKLNASTGTLVSNWGGTGSGNGQFNTPWGVATNGTHVYVVDSGNQRVQKFTTAGVFVAKWSIAGTATPNPLGCALDGSGNLWVTDEANDVLLRYSNTGALQATISQANGYGVAVASGDVVWVTNGTSHNIAKWDEAAAGYGGLAIEIDGNLSSYITLGDVKAMLQNGHARTVAGPATISVKVYGKATSGAATFRSVVLSARAVPRA